MVLEFYWDELLFKAYGKKILYGMLTSIPFDVIECDLYF